MPKKKYPLAYVPRTQGFDIAIQSGAVCEWLGHRFPEEFTVAIGLPDIDPESERVWIVECEIKYVESELQIVGTRIGGLTARPSNITEDGIFRLSDPIEVGLRWTPSKVERWQYEYISKQYLELEQTVFEVALRGIEHHPFEPDESMQSTLETLSESERIALSSGVTVTGQEARNIPPDTFEKFARDFRRTKGRRKWNDHELKNVSRLYLEEMEQANIQNRRPRPKEVIKERYGITANTTVDYCIKECRDRNFLPEYERSTTGKPIKQARERGFLQPIERIEKDNKVTTPKVGSNKTNKLEMEKK